MSSSTNCTVPRGYVRKSSSLAAACSIAVALLGASAFADGESLAETGGYVPTDAPALAFKNIALADLGTTVFPSVSKGGGWAGGEARVPLLCRTEVKNGDVLQSVSYQAQWFDGGYLKCATITFTGGIGGVYAQTTAAKYIGSNDTGSNVDEAYGTDFSGGTVGSVADSASSNGYGFHSLALHTVADIDSININFNDAEATKVTPRTTTTAVGPSVYAVMPACWSQMLGTNNNTLNGVTAVGDDGEIFYASCASTVTITGTRGTYSDWRGTYPSASDVRYGYIDEADGTYSTPTVTITNIPFDYYKVVFIPSTDTGDSKFGYITVNGKNYSSDNLEKATDGDYNIVSDSTAAWGKTQVADYLHGVNYLVTPVHANNSGKTLTVTGHKSNGRGCIAAIQIVNGLTYVHGQNIAASAINAVSIEGEPAYIKLDAGATLTLDEALTASKLCLCSDGSVTLSAVAQPSAEYLAKIDVSSVKGAVLRSWLEPGVVGFNFNADGYRSDNTSTTIDGCNDTALALEIGTWFRNGRDYSGSSTELFADGLSKLTWSSANVYTERKDISNGTFIQGYLDDGNGGATISLTGVPYETYDVIIYCSTDDSSKSFKAKVVNDTIYTWDATAGETTTTSSETATWGLASAAAGKAVYGANTLRVNGLSGTLSIKGGTNGNNARGCISAIQIMPTGTSTAPTMTVGAAGEATAATWTNSGLWEGGVIPSSGTAKIIVAGDVTLTIDDNVSLSAVTVKGSGSLKLVKGDGATVAFDSLSSAAVQIILPDASISIPTLSAPVKYLYKTETIVSTAAGVGNTYTQGAGTSEAAVTITHNGGSATLTGGTYYLGQSENSNETTVDFVDATAVYSSPLSIGTATYVIGGTSSVTAPRIVLSNGAAGRTSVMTVKDSASITITGGVDGDTNQGNMFGHYNGPSTFTIQDNATFTCANYEILVGRTGNAQTININGGVFTTKGLKLSGNASGVNTLNLNGGVLALGESGIGTYGASRTMAVNVVGGSEIRAMAATLPITQAMVLSAQIRFTKADGVAAATVTPASIDGTGAIFVGAGVTLNLGANRPEGQITVDDDGVLAVVMADKSEAPVLHVSAQPKTVKLYAVDGVTEYADATVEYDSEAGTITVKSPRPVWNSTADSAFDTVGNWSTGELPGNGQDATVNFASDTDMTVSGSYTLGDLAFTGSGDATVSGEGSISASSYDFSATTGRIEYDLPTGSAPVTSGANTLLLFGGSGTPTVAAGRSLTLGPWGATEDDETWTYTPMLMPAIGSTLMFSPGEGKKQKLSGGFGGTNAGTTIGVTNGMLIVNMNGSSDSVFFGANSVRIDDGGIVSLEAQDALGYGNARLLTINKGGVLAVNVRDTLRRTVNFNGGKIEIKGAHGDRGLDFYGLTMTVTDNSSIDQLEAQSKVGMRRDTTVINMNDGKTLAINANLYHQDSNAGLTVRAADGQGNQNGVVQLNGYSESPKQTFNGTVTVGEANKAAMLALNCEHENGTYVVNAASRFMGTGSVTGNGGVTLVASNSKLCGSLTVNNLTAASGGTYGDQWNSVAAKVATSYFAAGTQTIENGSFTIGADCVVTNSEGTVDTTAAAFSITANGNLKLEKSVTVAGLTVAGGGTITLVAASKNSVPALNIAGDTSFAGKVNFIMDFGSASAPGGRTYTLVTGTLPSNLANVSVSDGRGEKKWKVFIDGGALKASSSGSFTLRLR